MTEKEGKTMKKSVRPVFTIAERNGKSYWIRIGGAFVNQDGSETVLLDALPVNGKMQIRDIREKDRRGEHASDV